MTCLLAVGAFLIGGSATVPLGEPVQVWDGVPVGVDHSAAGAVAAADEYMITEQSTVERDPRRFAVFVAGDYAARIREAALTAGQSIRARDAGGVRLWARGGRSFAFIGAHRLDRYGRDSAQVTVWAGEVFWGPGQVPCQVWALARTTLVWRGGRWLVTAMRTLPKPGPVPAALPQAGSHDGSARALDAELEGFTPVSYGTPR